MSQTFTPGVKDLCKVVSCDMCAATSPVQICVCTYCHQALPGFEQGLLESESNVIANYTIEPICLRRAHTDNYNHFV